VERLLWRARLPFRQAQGPELIEGRAPSLCWSDRVEQREDNAGVRATREADYSESIFLNKSRKTDNSYLFGMTIA